MISSPMDPRHERPSLRRALESAGFLVFEATGDGPERERLRELWAALILLGLPVPRLGGLEVFRRLRGAGDDTPEAVIVTHGRLLEPTAVVRLGLVDVLARPLTPEAVRAAVEEVLRPAAGPRPGREQPVVLVAVEPLVLVLLRAKGALDRREFGAAGRLLLKALATDPASAVAHNLMGVFHRRLGEHHAAYRSFMAALRADPGYEPALENLRRHRKRFGPEFPGSSGRAAG
jgi:DNA-binding response OmpR family regulator